LAAAAASVAAASAAALAASLAASAAVLVGPSRGACGMHILEGQILRIVVLSAICAPDPHHYCAALLATRGVASCCCCCCRRCCCYPPPPPVEPYACERHVALGMHVVEELTLWIVVLSAVCITPAPRLPLLLTLTAACCRCLLLLLLLLSSLLLLLPTVHDPAVTHSG
jgi:hypothetical protein